MSKKVGELVHLDAWKAANPARVQERLQDMPNERLIYCLQVFFPGEDIEEIFRQKVPSETNRDFLIRIFAEREVNDPSAREFLDTVAPTDGDAMAPASEQAGVPATVEQPEVHKFLVLQTDDQGNLLKVIPSSDAKLGGGMTSAEVEFKFKDHIKRYNEGQPKLVRHLIGAVELATVLIYLAAAVVVGRVIFSDPKPREAAEFRNPAPEIGEMPLLGEQLFLVVGGKYFPEIFPVDSVMLDSFTVQGIYDSSFYGRRLVRRSGELVGYVFGGDDDKIRASIFAPAVDNNPW